MILTANPKNQPERWALLGDDETENCYFLMIRDSDENLALFQIDKSADAMQTINAQAILMSLQQGWIELDDKKKQYTTSLANMMDEFESGKQSVGLKVPAAIKRWQEPQGIWQ